MEEVIISEMKKIFCNDEKRIEHALAVLNYAKIIAESEECDLDIIIASAILHDIGINEAEKKYNSSAGNYQEIEGPPIAESILKKHNYSVESINHIKKIIANHHSAKNIDTIEFYIIWDSDWLVNIDSENMLINKNNLQRVKFLEKTFKTNIGLKLAKKKYLI